VRRPALKHAGALLIAIAVGLAAGAFAYWQGTGSGTATTTLADAQSLSFEPGKPTSQLFPGGDANVAIIASNPNSFFVQIGSMVLDSDDPEPFLVDAAHSGCDVSALSFVSQNNGGSGWQVPPRVGLIDGTLTIDMSAAMKMSTAASDACQGATFGVRLEMGP
jgi:hypothetical protein